MSFDARNALMLAKKIVDSAAEYKKAAQKADGGEVERKTNKVGLFSKAAEQARQLPSGPAPAAQLIGTLRNKGGIKAEELANAGITDETGKNLTPEWQSKGKMTPEELAHHFETAMPQVEETVLGVAPKAIPYPEEYQKTEQSIIDKYKPEMEKHHNIYLDRNNEQHIRNAAQRNVEDLRDQMWAEIDRALPDREEHLAKAKPEVVPTKYGQYALPGGENYREVLLKLPAKNAQKDFEYLVSGRFPNTFETREEAENYIEQLNNLHNAHPEMDVHRFPVNIIKQRKAASNPSENFWSNHWNDPNILAHIRMADRTGPNGEKILHVEEVQSDWGQKGKKEGFGNQAEFDAWNENYKDARKQVNDTKKEMSDYVDDPSRKPQFVGGKMSPREYEGIVRQYYESLEQDPKFLELRDAYRSANNQYLNIKNTKPEYSGIPSAPYVTSTPGWTDLALKRILKEAAEGGYDKIVWTPGEEQAKRYDLSEHIDHLEYHPETTDLIGVRDGQSVFNKSVEPHEIENYVGKDVAKNLLSQPLQGKEYSVGGFHSLSGQDLAVGGKGMKEYYDNMLPRRLQEVAKKHDKNAKVAYTDILLPPSGRNGSNDPPIQAPGMDITPQMRDSILKGQEAYARGGDVMHTRKVPKPHTPVVGEKQYKPHHPAMMIPGVHIIEGIHGVPFFMGKK